MLEMLVSWTLPEFIGYLYTWSATQRLIAAEHRNPLEPLFHQLAESWPTHDDGAEAVFQPLTIVWPLSIRASRKDGQRS